MQRLYLMVGLPGAGKTVAAIAIANVTGAKHLWADDHRKKKYQEPLFSSDENRELYHELNVETELLLELGESVVYDTAFNYYEDRKILRAKAKELNADTLVVWVQTPEETARERATQDAHAQDTRVLGNMSHDHFERLKTSLETPREDEKTITLDGTKITDDYVREKLKTIG